MQTLALRIIGLDCAEEVSALKKTVGALPGVSKLEFDILNAKMTVSFDPSLTGESAVASAVRRAGLSSRGWDDNCSTSVCATSAPLHRNYRLIACVLSGILLFAGTITHYVFHPNLLDVVAGGESTPTRFLSSCYTPAP